jgi:hypothetical protein
MLTPLLDLLSHSWISPQAAQRGIRLHSSLHRRIIHQNPDKLEQAGHALLHCRTDDVLPDGRVSERSLELRVALDLLPHGGVLQ